MTSASAKRAQRAAGERSSSGWVDYWCNAFTPDRRDLWSASVQRQRVPLKVRVDPEDSFAEPEAMVTRMDELGVATLVLPTCECPPHAGPTDYEPFAARPEETLALAKRFPGRFAGAWSLDPSHGMAGVRRAERALAEPWAVALHVHTHSWDRPFDCADYYPYYALAAERGVPVVMQAGSSGGLMPSACGRPIGIDRPALYFPDLVCVLSHTGWPWVDEALAMALKFPNVYLGTATYPPGRWPAALVDFARGAGRHKLLAGTGFPIVGHRHALAQLEALEPDAALRERWLGGNARAVFHRLFEE
jgi:hypothetical protein